MLFRRDLPLHAFGWVRGIYAAHAGDVPFSAEPNASPTLRRKGTSNANSANLPFSPVVPKRCSQGFVIEAFRGSSKTTSISVAFLAFRIGLNPQDSFLVLQATAAAARATCRQVADLIANNIGWHVAFPHVVPDKKVGWSLADGFEVKRDDMDYGLWRQLCAETKGRDRTFVGLGYRSSSVVGLHPTGMLLADDIHNETNTRSVKEMDKAVAIITSNILPTLNPNSWKVFIGTPWRQGDVLQYLKATETYASVSTPIYTEVPDTEVPTEPSTQVRESLLGDSRVDSPTRCEATQAHGNAPLNPEGGETPPLPENNSQFKIQHSEFTISSPTAGLHPANSTSGGEGSGVSGYKTNSEITGDSNSSINDSLPLSRGRAGDGVWSTRELTWPARFPIPVIENYRQMLGEREFARMYLLDLSAAEGIHLKAEWLQKVDSSTIQPTWPVVMGVDYASTADKQRNNDRDYFAVAIGRAQPSGSGIILIDGFRGHLSQAEAQEKLLELVAFYPNTEVIGIETVGKGEEFYHRLSSHPALPIFSMNPGGEGKGTRFQNAMAPLFERGWARISDIESPFMQAFRREWLRWPWGDHDDTLDATYWMLRAGQAHLPPRPDKAKSPSPFSDLGRN